MIDRRAWVAGAMMAALCAGAGAARAAECVKDCAWELRDEEDCCPTQAALPRKDRKAATSCKNETTCARECSDGVDKACGRLRSLADKGCSDEVLSSCSRLAYLQWEGLGGPRDPKEAVRIYESACMAGDGEACRLGCFHAFNGVARDPDATRAKQLCDQMIKSHDRDCADGDGQRCLALAEVYEHGWVNVKADEALRAKYEARACDLRVGSACRSQSEGVLPTDHALTLALAETACDLGDARGCSKAARHSREPREAARLYARAVQLHDPSCKRGNVTTCVVIASLYEESKKTTKARAYAKRSGDLFHAQCRRGWKACIAGFERFVRDAEALEASGEEIDLSEEIGKAILDKLRRLIGPASADCRRGDRHACLMASLVEGEDDAKLDEKGELMTVLACEQSDEIACSELVEDPLLGWLTTIPEDRKRRGENAVAKLVSLCNGGSSFACYAAGEEYSQGYYVTKEVARGDELMASGCRGGAPQCSPGRAEGGLLPHMVPETP